MILSAKGSEAAANIKAATNTLEADVVAAADYIAEKIVEATDAIITAAQSTTAVVQDKRFILIQKFYKFH
jgi:hypothetical protein